MAEHVGETPPRRLKTGPEPHQHGGGETGNPCEDERASIEANRVQTWDVWRCERNQDVHGPVREDEAGGASKDCQDQSIGERLPHDAPSRGADRQTNCSLMNASRRPGEQQDGDVRATNQQDEPDASGKREQCRPRGTENVLVERRQDGFHARAEQRAGTAREHPGHLALSRADGRARVDPTEHEEEADSRVRE